MAKRLSRLEHAAARTNATRRQGDGVGAEADKQSLWRGQVSAYFSTWAKSARNDSRWTHRQAENESLPVAPEVRGHFVPGQKRVGDEVAERVWDGKRGEDGGGGEIKEGVKAGREGAGRLHPLQQFLDNAVDEVDPKPQTPNPIAPSTIL